MQELISILSIMLGTIVLTAWVMWIILRPSGDNMVDEFATESARDGITVAVIENNELKNQVTRLERELKILLNAGQGKKQEESGKGKGGEKAKGERLKVKGDGQRITTEESGKGKVERKDERKVSEKVRGESGKSQYEELRAIGERLKAGDKKVKGERITAEESGKWKGERNESEKLKAKSLKLKEKTGAGGLPVGGAPRGEDLGSDKESKRRQEHKPSEELRAKWTSAGERGTIVDQRSLLRGDEGQTKDEGLRAKDEEKLKGERITAGESGKWKVEREVKILFSFFIQA